MEQHQQQQQMMYLQQQIHQQHMQQQQQQQQKQLVQQIEEPPADEDLDIPTTTVMGTRSNSERSLGSMNPGSVMTTGGWNSTMDTAANNSRALSPVSFSDIPASPTMCSQMPGFFGGDLDHQQQLSGAPTNTAQNMTHHSSDSANTMTRSDGTTMPIDNLVTPTYALLNPTAKPEEPNQQAKVSRKSPVDLDSPDDVLPGPTFNEDEGDYAIIEGGAQRADEELLTRSIQSEMPTSSSTPKMKVSPRLNGFFSPPQKTPTPATWNHHQSSPIPKQPPQRIQNHQGASDADRLLMESIMSEMPRLNLPSPRSGQYLEPERRSHSKNGEADRRDAFIASHEPSDQGFNPARGSEKSPQQLQRMESLESQASSEDSFGLVADYEHEANVSSSVTHTMRIENDVDASLPMDCVDDDDYDYTEDHYEDYDDEEEDPDATQFDDGINPHLTIDCSMISSGSGSGSSLPRGETTTTSRDSRALATSTPKGSSSSIPGMRTATRVSTTGKSRLPVPKTNGSLVDKVANLLSNV